jgi:hypothetical protein
MDLATGVSLLGAVGAGSVLSQYASGGRQRRELRAQVLTALRACESERWVSVDEKRDVRFPDRVRDLEAAALVARLPRRAVSQYASLSLVAHWLSSDAAEDDEDGRGGIPGKFSDIVRESAALVTGLTWSPRRSRWRMNRRVDELNARADELGDKEVERRLENARAR